MTRFCNERALFSYTGLTPARIRQAPRAARHSSRQVLAVVSATCSSKRLARVPRDAVLQRDFRQDRGDPGQEACHCGYRATLTAGFVPVFARERRRPWGRMPKHPRLTGQRHDTFLERGCRIAEALCMDRDLLAQA